MSQTDEETPRVILIDGRHGSASVVREIRDRLASLGVEVVEALPNAVPAGEGGELRRLSRRMRLERLLAALAAQPRGDRDVMLANPYFPGDDLAQCVAPDKADRPAWVSPYGPARGRR